MQSVKPNELPQNPYERTNIFARLCYWYTLSTFFKGRNKSLNTEDLYRALSEHESEILGNKICQSWQKELYQKAYHKKQPSLLKATIRVFGCRYAFLGLILFVLELGSRSSQPAFLMGLIAYYTSGEQDRRMAYLYAAGVVVSSIMNVMFSHIYSMGTMHLGMKMRVAMCSLIYRKSLRLSKTAVNSPSAGQVINLISNDVGRLDVATTLLHYLWVGPILTCMITYRMYSEIGISAVFGVAFMLMFIPLQVWLGKQTSALRLRTASRTDERVRMMNEIISGIQVIKMYAWENAFCKLVTDARKKEINSIRYSSYIRGILFSYVIFLTRVSVFLSLVGFVLLCNTLTAEKVFLIAAYYNILRSTMTVFFPEGVSILAETLVSLKRIQAFLLSEETQVMDKSNSGSCYNDNNAAKDIRETDDEISQGKDIEEQPLVANGHSTVTTTGIIINNFKAKWDPRASDYNLNDINLRIEPGTLVAIIGPVGSGKSSLIQSILGELKPAAGTIKVNGTLSYASQEPWLFTGTVRKNILFGQPMDRSRYRAVVKKCALEKDFKLLPYGDKTIVGERGASLSGGQKARISLARAVYCRTSIYLLDDPLSAVDTHVGRHLFDKCMRGLLRDNIVVLVTHQLQFLQSADQIVIMDKGRICAMGSYESLSQNGHDFAQMLTETINEDSMEATKTRSRSESQVKDRRSSVTSINSLADSVYQDTPSQGEETQEEGKIGLDLYKKYFKAGGGFFMFIVMLMFCVVSQGLASCGDYFLSYWVNKKRTEEANRVELVAYLNATANGTSTTPTEPFIWSPSYRTESSLSNWLSQYGIHVKSDMLDIYIFTIITVTTIVLTITRSFVFFNMAMRASQNLHNAMFRGIIRASMYFFNTNASGRILNRFSKDMGQIDENLPSVMIDAIQIFLSIFAIVVVISVINPLYLLPTMVLVLIFYNLRAFYLKTSRSVKRLEAINRSPIYSHLGASMSGLSTIRAFGAQRILIKEFDNYQDLHSSAFFLFSTTSRAFGYWLDCCCVLFIAVVTLSFFIFAPENGGEVGLAITQVMSLTGMVQWGMRQSAELENGMTAVERVVEYDDIQPEGELESKDDKKPPETWPEAGKVIFNDLSLRYDPDPKSEYVLKSLNIDIKPREKVGIVGRTGAGKSSLINALFRLSYTNGSIIIDSRDTKSMGLHDLRSKISIIPQEPVLFSGTMRYNLDPFGEYSDAKLWEALEEVQLKKVVSELESGLETKIAEGGSNFSVGQRQLVCLARAILRENRILVMDEATANVDAQTDTLIQTTIRHKFKHCTVLTIAHRLHTVMDSDKVLVMDAGRVIEFGSPFELLTESDKKVFLDMVEQTGKSTSECLLQIAQKAHDEKFKPRNGIKL
ncbi:probable multidrug resistance-associated protein lethal(2)03659 [Musca vetustissima]|uniref:probable multidrug resistance-associated protein lethal(2)03659 n=1 Tax=Musca vetustissima TaxID=27455 RepID=UPI002AB68A3E|nr:probable multidrug resistance-associated protein lethal(2)03659 [Musca vetustissima]